MKHVLPPADLVNRTLTIIGGVVSSDGKLSENDRDYLHIVKRVLETLGVPFDPAVDGCEDEGQTIDAFPVDVMNMGDGGLGGKRDFLKEKISTDILFMANVAYRQSEGGDYLEDLPEHEITASQAFQLKSSIRVSSENSNEELWRTKIKNSGARVIVIVGDDDFPPEKIAGDDYILLKNAISGFAGILIERAYLKALKPSLKEPRMPLFSVAVAMASNSDYVSFQRDDFELKFHPVPTAPKSGTDIQAYTPSAISP